MGPADATCPHAGPHGGLLVMGQDHWRECLLRACRLGLHTPRIHLAGPLLAEWNKWRTAIYFGGTTKAFRSASANSASVRMALSPAGSALGGRMRTPFQQRGSRFSPFSAGRTSETASDKFISRVNAFSVRGSAVS